MTKDETQSILYRELNNKWLTLTIYMCYTFLQYFIFNIFAAIVSSVKNAFSWENKDVIILCFWDSVLIIFFTLSASWFLQNKGLRKSLIYSLALMVIGSGVRCLPLQTNNAKWILNVGMIFNALGGVLIPSAGAYLSNTWFPHNQRATSTAMSYMAGRLGLAFSSIVGPVIVPDLPDSTINRLKTIKTMHSLMYYILTSSLLLLVTVATFFRNQPRFPPSKSASLKRMEFKHALSKLARMKAFWSILTVLSTIPGIFSAWYSVLPVNLMGNGLPITQIECGRIAFTSTILGSLSCILFGRLADKFTVQLKVIVIGLYLLSTFSFAIMVFVSLGFIPYHVVSIYLCCIVVSCTVIGSGPLLYELLIETTYPVPETVSIGVAGFVESIVTSLILLLFQIPNIGISWVNWSMLITCVLAIFLLTLTRVRYTRSDLDQAS